MLKLIERSFTLSWRIGETKMSKLIGSLILQRGKKNLSIIGTKTVTIEKCNTHTLYYFVNGIIPKIINNTNSFQHYDATKKKDTE